MPDMPPTHKGILLGMANATVISVLLALTFAPSHAQKAGMVAVGSLIGMVPGAVIGALVGMLAGRVRRYRLLVMAAVTCGVLGCICVGLAWLDGLHVTRHLDEVLYIWALLCVPTVAMASILERWTRRDIASPLPDARVVTT